MYSAIAAMTLTSILSNNSDEYAKLFDPNRLKPIAGFSNFVKEGADVVKKLITGKFPAEKLELIAGIAAGEAAIVKYEGHIIAMYKDETHQLHALNPGCTHINCTVKWNTAEKSWDCPCHGSRFAIDGEVLTGPAQQNLQQIFFDSR